MTRDEFNGEMVRMLGLRFAPATMDTHWEGLQSIPLADLHRGVTRAILSRSEFPTPAELRADCDAERVIPQEAPSLARGAEMLPEPVPLGTLPDGTVLPAATHVWTYFCDKCSDAGWQSCWCGDVATNRWHWIGVHGHCGRYGEHPPHEWVRHCACYATNPKLLRERERVRKYEKEPAETRRRGRAA